MYAFVWFSSLFSSSSSSYYMFTVCRSFSYWVVTFSGFVVLLLTLNKIKVHIGSNSSLLQVIHIYYIFAMEDSKVIKHFQ
jgi:hypothetical protein